MTKLAFLAHDLPKLLRAFWDNERLRRAALDVLL